MIPAPRITVDFEVDDMFCVYPVETHVSTNALTYSVDTYTTTVYDISFARTTVCGPD